MKVSIKKGFSLLETLMVTLIMGFLLLATMDMLSSAFNAQAHLEKDIKTKQSKVIASEKIVSIAREASAALYSTSTLTIPVKSSIITVTPENQSLAIFVPKFDSNGAVIRPTSSSTSFEAIAYSIVPKSYWDSTSTGSSDYILVETHMDVNLATTAIDALKITQTLPSDFSSGVTYLLAEDFKPAQMTKIGTTAFDVEGDMVSFSLVPRDGFVYFPSSNGTITVDDSRYLTSFKFKNFRIQ